MSVGKEADTRLLDEIAEKVNFSVRDKDGGAVHILAVKKTDGLDASSRKDMLQPEVLVYNIKEWEAFERQINSIYHTLVIHMPKGGAKKPVTGRTII